MQAICLKISPFLTEKIMYKIITIAILFTCIISCSKNKSKEKKLFEKIDPSQSNINFKNLINDTTDLTIFDSDLIYSGAGVGIGDFNNDGLQDIILIGNQVESKLYLNKGNFKFDDITKKSGITTSGWTTGVSIADVNGDGFLDIYICVSGFRQEKNKRNLLYINNGNLTFTEKAKEYGIDDNGSSSSAAFFDYDNDSDLDLFVVNYPDDIKNTFEIPFYLDPKRIDTLNCNQFYENVNGKFRNATVKSKIGYKNSDSFQVTVSDINNDGYIDIYITNDLLQPDFLYINNKNGTFTESFNKIMNLSSLFSMGSSIADINNDSKPDIITTEMMPSSHFRRKNSMVHPDVDFFEFLLKDQFKSNQHSRNMFHLQNDDGTFSEIGELANMSRTDWSWAVLPCDYNLNGLKDLFITTGVKRDLFNQTYLSLAFDGEDPQDKKYSHEDLELILKMPIYHAQNYLYENLEGYSFRPVMDEWGISDFVASQGASFADFNNDGSPDLLISNTDSLSYLYKNNCRGINQNKFLKINFRGQKLNSFGLGAKAFVYYKNQKQYQELQTSIGYISSSEPTMFFGLGETKTIDSIAIVWLGGKMEKIYQLPSDTFITVYEKNASLKYNYKPTTKTDYLFKPSKELDKVFKHEETNFNDFKRDKLLHKRISREGPGLAVGDINNDDHEDFFIAGSSGQPGKLFIQKSGGEFVELQNQAWEEDSMYEDMGVLFVDLDQNGFQDLIITSGSNEFNSNSEWLNTRIYYNKNGVFSKKTIIETNDDTKSSLGVVKVCDLNKDGLPDIFIGGRLIPSMYPSAPKSFIYINEKGKLMDKSNQWLKDIQRIGMVSDAKFYDFNKDGLDDLILVGEWMPITILHNTGNHFENKTSDYGLQNTKGWWNSVCLSDFNADGEMDIFAGNFGYNSIFKASIEKPIKLFYGKYGKTDKKFPIICYEKEDILAPYADRDLWLRSLPSYQNMFLTYEKYAQLSIYDILSEDQIQSSTIFEAQTFSTCVFLKTGKSFTKKDLPIQAQIAPVYGSVVIDYDQDGKDDLLLFGNSYSTGYEDGKMAASRGQLFKGKGDGTFGYIQNYSSGFDINADSKSAGIIFQKKKNENSVIIGINNDYNRAFQLPGKMKRLAKTNRILGSGYLFNYTPKGK